MTDQEIDLLEAGDALDELVVKAVGLKGYDLEPGFMPSYDWNSAMECLDLVVGPTVRYPACSVKMAVNDDCGWNVELYDHDDSLLALVEHHSGPVAICRAILKAVKPR